MSAVIVGSLMVTLPIAAYLVWLTMAEGLRFLIEYLFLLAGLFGALSVVMAGIYLITEGWPT